MKWRKVLIGLASTACAVLAVGTIAVGPAWADTMPARQLGLGTYSLRAAYSGDESSSGSSSTAVTLTAATQPTTTHLFILDPTGTTVTGDPSIVFGDEQGYSFSINVSAAQSSTPTGTVTITDTTASGTITLCSSTLDSLGDILLCAALGPSTLPVGSNQITATYTGDGVHASSSTQRTITVLPVLPTTTTLTLSSPSVPFGSEQTETLMATVTHAGSGAPTGKVTVTTGTTTVCTITLTGGTGKCALPSGSLLRPGSYPLTATYSGDATDTTSSDTSQTLVVAKEPTTTTLALSADTVALGSEDAEQFTVEVDPATSGTPTGNVTVKVGAVGLCTIPLASGTTCFLKPSQLKVGSYQITATYNGDSTYASSISTPPQTLNVVDL